MTVDNVIAKIIWLTFFGPPCICRRRLNTQLFTAAFADKY